MTGIAAFTWNVMLALVWSAAMGELSLVNLLTGFLMGFLALAILRRFLGVSGYVVKVWQAMSLAAFFVWELVVANVRVAWDVMTPGYRMQPGVIAVPLDAESDLEITLLANLITLTPGTLSLDVSADRRVLFIHAMYLDPEHLDEMKYRIKDGFERRILELLRS